jgi:disulfide bond formation protein DsbB
MSMSLNRLIPAFIVLVTLGALSLALTAQHVYLLEPCILCLYQRIPFIVTGLLAVLALRLKGSSGLIALIIIVCGLVYLVGAGIAVYHVGIEQHWWISGCSGTLSDSVSLQDLRTSLMQKPEKSCDDVDWTLFGISMATYNVFGSSVLGVASVTMGIQMSKTRKT